MKVQQIMNSAIASNYTYEKEIIMKKIFHQKHSGTYRSLIHSFYEHNRISFLFSILFYIFFSTEGVAVSWLLGQVTDTMTSGDLHLLKKLGIMTVICIFAYLILECTAQKIKSVFVHRGLKQYKDQAFFMLSQKSVSSFNEKNTGSYISALTNDITAISDDYLNGTVLIIFYTVQFLLCLATMIYYSPVLTFVVIALSLLPVAVSLIMGKGLTSRERTVSDYNEGFTARIKDLMNGFSVIKSFQAEAQAQNLFVSENDRLEHAKEEKRFYSGLVSIISQWSSGIVQFGLFFVGAILAIRGAITAGTVLYFVNICNFLLTPIQIIPQYLAERRAAAGLIEKYSEMIDAGQSAEKLSIKGLKQCISLKNLNFCYEENQPVLKDVSFDFEKGKSYCIVGASGSGKSTLLNLLLGTYDNYTGSLLFDGTEAKEISADSFYDFANLISQNVFLFDDTIQNNITLFRDFSADRISEAVQKSGLQDVIALRGEDYCCGENGAGLSGGERQRISIARSLLKGSSILLVDEATSALDNETARHVSNAILDLDGLTRIVVTHRLESAVLERYDSILMFKNGILCESGDFRSLMEKKGQFYSLYTVSGEPA